MTVNIGITCVGSGIGQSAVNALRLCSDTYRIIEFDANPLAFGGFFCDVFHKTIPNQEVGYVESLIDICCREHIKVIIPGLDDDLVLLSRAKKLFNDHNITVLVSPESVIELCRDKKRLSQEQFSLFPEIVASYSCEEAEEEIEKGRLCFPLIAKPRTGSGSVGVRLVKNLDEFRKISPDYIIQPFILLDASDPDSSFLIEGMGKGDVMQVAEISIQYLISRRGKVMGKMATRNRLKAGVPVEIIPVDIPLIWHSTQRIVEHLMRLGAWGPVNFQGRLLSNGIRIFEINPRFTGLTGLRAKIGFNEVEACLLDYLGASEARIQKALDFNSSHIGVRQVTDVKVSPRIKTYTSEYIEERKMGRSESQGKSILLTGATGYIGQNLLQTLLKDPKIKRVTAVSRTREKAASVLGSIQNEKLEFLFLDEIPVKNFNFGYVDVIVHLGESRTPQGDQALAQSLEFSNSLVMQAASYQVPEFIYASSQAVYGEKTQLVPCCEEDLACPNSPYAMAKWAGEKIVQRLKNSVPYSQVKILRLARIYGKGLGMRWNEMPHKFVDDFWKRKEICVFGGKQMFDLLHIDDVISGIQSVINGKHGQNNLI